MKIIVLILAIIGFVISKKIIDIVYQLYMKLIGAEQMYFNGKKKLFAICILGLFITSFLCKILGLAPYLEQFGN